jgi:hypothetical protein
MVVKVVAAGVERDTLFEPCLMYGSKINEYMCYISFVRKGSLFCMQMDVTPLTLEVVSVCETVLLCAHYEIH